MNDKLPKAISTATVSIMGVDMNVHQLDNGQRVIDADSIEEFFAAMEMGMEITPEAAKQIAEIVQ